MDSVGASVSALTAFRKKMNVTSNNVANVLTDGFKKSRVTLEEGANGGVSAIVDRVDTPGIPRETIRNDEVVEVESSNVDLAEEITEMIPTRAAYSANIKALKNHDEMLGNLLDLLS